LFIGGGGGGWGGGKLGGVGGKRAPAHDSAPSRGGQNPGGKHQGRGLWTGLGDLWGKEGGGSHSLWQNDETPRFSPWAGWGVGGGEKTESALKCKSRGPARKGETHGKGQRNPKTVIPPGGRAKGWG